MPTTEKLSITLPPDMVQAIKARVNSGAYASTSEVIRDAMRLWQRRENEYAERIEAIRSRIRRSLDDPRPDLDDSTLTARLDALHERSYLSLKNADDDVPA